MYCWFKFIDEGLMVSDMESMNGVKVNGELVEGVYFFVDGDFFLVGEVGFVYYWYWEIEEDVVKLCKCVGKFVV